MSCINVQTLSPGARYHFETRLIFPQGAATTVLNGARVRDIRGRESGIAGAHTSTANPRGASSRPVGRGALHRCARRIE